MLNHYLFGTGNEIIWLHGGLGSKLTFRNIAKGVNGKNYLLEARNHGNSFCSKGMDHKTQALDILKFMDGHNIEKTSLVGHSMGGKTAMMLACLHPERINKLCVIDTAPISYIETMKDHILNLKKYLNFIKYENITGKTRKEIKDLIQLKFNNKISTKILSSNLKGYNGKFTWAVNPDYFIDEAEKLAGWEDPQGSFNGPTLVIAGEKSFHTIRYPLYPEGFDIKILYEKYFSDVRIEIVKNVGHYLHIEDPDTTKKLIIQFFNNNNIIPEYLVLFSIVTREVLSHRNLSRYLYLKDRIIKFINAELYYYRHR
jgi:esterase